MLGQVKYQSYFLLDKASHQSTVYSSGYQSSWIMGFQCLPRHWISSHTGTDSMFPILPVARAQWAQQAEVANQQNGEHI